MSYFWKIILPIMFVGALILSACVPTGPTSSSPHNGGGGHTQTTPTEKRKLTVHDQSSGSKIAFAVQESSEIFTEYGISHTKEMHLIVVRKDLRHFQHVHPERDADGVWRIPFTAPAGGEYWLYADFVDDDENTYTIRFERSYAGDPGSQGIAKNVETVKTVDGYRISFQPEVAGDEVTFTYDITNAQGQRPQLEEYLGATGHSVLISPSGDFIHTHSSEQGETPLFATSMPSDNFYRIFTQFQINGKVLTVSFDWQRRP